MCTPADNCQPSRNAVLLPIVIVHRALARVPDYGLTSTQTHSRAHSRARIIKCDFNCCINARRRQRSCVQKRAANMCLCAIAARHAHRNRRRCVGRAGGRVMILQSHYAYDGHAADNANEIPRGASLPERLPGSVHCERTDNNMSAQFSVAVRRTLDGEGGTATANATVHV